MATCLIHPSIPLAPSSTSSNLCYFLKVLQARVISKLVSSPSSRHLQARSSCHLNLQLIRLNMAASRSRKAFSQSQATRAPRTRQQPLNTNPDEQGSTPPRQQRVNVNLSRDELANSSSGHKRRRINTQVTDRTESDDASDEEPNTPPRKVCCSADASLWPPSLTFEQGASHTGTTCPETLPEALPEALPGALPETLRQVLPETLTETLPKTPSEATATHAEFISSCQTCLSNGLSESSSEIYPMVT
jgi:hypothetical protein